MPSVRSADSALMREMNIALILQCLNRQAPLSRARLARITGLTKATVSSLINELIDAGFIREVGIVNGHKGRPSIQLELDPDVGYIIGAQIEVGMISVILSNFAAEVLWRHEEMTRELQSQDEILERLIDIISQAYRSAQRDHRPILGLGLGVPGLVDAKSGTFLFGPNLGWREVSLREILQEHFPFPIYVDNDAKMAALGESYFGSARSASYVLYLSSAVGLGAGVVIDRQILQGIAGLAGEVGHMIINPNGPLCACGNHGCWETYASQVAVFRHIRESVDAGQKTQLIEMTSGNLDLLTIPMVVQAAKDQDPVARRALEEVGTYLGLGLANLINALNPELVVLGGILVIAHEIILPIIKDVIEKRSLEWSRKTSRLVIAMHGRYSCLMGGIATVYHHVLEQPLVRAKPVSSMDEPALVG